MRGTRRAERLLPSCSHARFLSIAASNRASHDSSTIDYIHPPVTEHDGKTLPEVTRIPLLPDTETPHSERETPEEETIGRVIRPEISIVSGDGTQLDMPSAMSEVTDNHAAEIDPYDLTSKVHAAASKGPGQTTKPVEEPGSFKAVWNGILDDVFGERKPPQA